MRYKLSPQVSDKKILYEFSNETITAVYNGQIFLKDLSYITFEKSFKDIITDNPLDENGNIITCDFGFMPILNAYRDEENNLCVELLNFITKDASEEEKYPDWIIIN